MRERFATQKLRAGGLPEGLIEKSDLVSHVPAGPLLLSVQIHSMVGFHRPRALARMGSSPRIAAFLKRIDFVLPHVLNIIVIPAIFHLVNWDRQRSEHQCSQKAVKSLRVWKTNIDGERTCGC